jgi:hypothetical protein
MKDFPMPSGMKDGFRNAKDLWQKGMDTVGSASNAFNKAQTVAVDMFESKFRFLKCICIYIYKDSIVFGMYDFSRLPHNNRTYNKILEISPINCDILKVFRFNILII